MRKIVFYKTVSGNKPVEKFLDSLTGKQAQKVVWVLKLIEELEIIPKQYFKKLKGTDEIWEVRIQVGGNIFRILGFLYGKNLIVLNHAFSKKSQKITKKDIQLAEQRRQKYLRSKSDE